MKILITNSGPWGTGSFTLSKKVTEELIKLGHEVKLFFPDSALPCDDFDYYYQNPKVFEIWQFPIEKDGVKINNFPLMLPDPNPRNPEGKTLFDLSNQQIDIYFEVLEQTLKNLIESFKPDLITCQHIWTMPYVVKKLGYKYICEAHNSDQIAFEIESKNQSLALEAAKGSEMILAISRYVKDKVVSLYGVEPSKVKLAYSGYDEDLFKIKEVNREKVLNDLGLSIPENETIIAYAGAISRTKGFDVLLKANKLIQREKPIHIIVFGSGNFSDVVYDADAKNYSTQRVHFVGSRPQKILSDIYNISKLFVLPSRSEGFGIAALEAMACGLPCVVSSSGGTSEFSVGKVIESENVLALFNAILEICKLPKHEYERLSKKAIKEADKFSWDQMIKKRLEYYLAIGNNKD
jgi:glycosyltransferase involved in cell wall biosynthesis